MIAATLIGTSYWKVNTVSIMTEMMTTNTGGKKYSNNICNDIGIISSILLQFKVILLITGLKRKRHVVSSSSSRAAPPPLEPLPRTADQTVEGHYDPTLNNRIVNDEGGFLPRKLG
mmetsp:Transcript_15865/g.28800  ORF Transcript_15865/g.28800 Transcript_15865/m.28800 type:complete len:116 (-) Transcript_15865:139-486(-)